ncbi:DUF1285 domain-containing protein [Psychrobacter aestuarii]|uniref:DUF1285 domain-containing protein n=1 Tax=Psychrobacter aestuarii TaxID=556327 RepID=A0ABN0VSC0_9GAMM|nr:DUF1285 domain-containing protein [Psychrobacter aestuarii]
MSHADNAANAAPDLDTLSRYLKTSETATSRRIPPLEKWHPTEVATMDMHIKANGEWWHEGRKIERPALVSLFASILGKEVDDEGADRYYLKTPVQKLYIRVDDAPLYIQDVGVVMEDGVQWLEFTSSTEDVFRLNDAHLITLRARDNDAVQPYILVRHNLEALIARSVFYHLIELGDLVEKAGQTVLLLDSGGVRYEIGMPAD